MSQCGATRDEDTHTNGALLCSLVQVVRVVIVRVILVGVLCVTVVHIGHDEVLVVELKYVSIFVVIFCIWRCTLYRTPQNSKALFFEVLKSSPHSFNYCLFWNVAD